MSLLRGLMALTDKVEQGMDISTEEWQRRHYPDLSGEPTLEEMLSDPVIRSVMDRDHVSNADVFQAVRGRSRAAA